MRLVLASASPRRADLLRAAGFDFETFAPDVDESVRPSESPAEYVQRLASEKSAAAEAALTASAKATAVRRSFTRRRKGCATGAEPPGAAKSSTSRTSTTPNRAMPSTTLNTPTSLAPVAPAFRPASGIIVLGADTAVVVDGLILGKPRDDEESAAMLRQLSGRRHDVMTGISLRAGSRERRHVETTAVYFATLSDEDVAWYVRSGEGRDKAGAYAIQGLASRFIPRIEGSYANVVGLPIAAVCELIRSIETARQHSGTGD
jgi:septum formation protein